MTDDEDPTALKYVGPATAAVLEDARFGAADIREKAVSFRELLEAGVNPGVAGRIRREHSLPWAFDTAEPRDSEELRRRSAQVRGLEDEERAWVAASSGEWTAEDVGETDGSSTPAIDQSQPDSGADPAEADGSGDAVAAESAWRERARPTPVTDVHGVGEVTAEALADAGITSARALAAADPQEVAEALDLSEARLRRLRDNAADLLD